MLLGWAVQSLELWTSGFAEPMFLRLRGTGIPESSTATPLRYEHRVGGGGADNEHLADSIFELQIPRTS